jgi:hypothetical protein
VGVGEDRIAAVVGDFEGVQQGCFGRYRILRQVGMPAIAQALH